MPLAASSATSTSTGITWNASGVQSCWKKSCKDECMGSLPATAEPRDFQETHGVVAKSSLRRTAASSAGQPVQNRREELISSRRGCRIPDTTYEAYLYFALAVRNGDDCLGRSSRRFRCLCQALRYVP